MRLQADNLIQGSFSVTLLETYLADGWLYVVGGGGGHESDKSHDACRQWSHISDSARRADESLDMFGGDRTRFQGLRSNSGLRGFLGGT